MNFSDDDIEKIISSNKSAREKGAIDREIAYNESVKSGFEKFE
jgi:hypothetical protein